MSKNLMIGTTAIFALFYVSDLLFKSEGLRSIYMAVKSLSIFILVSLLAQMWMQIRRRPKNIIESKTQQNEAFYLKVITYLVSTPDEIALALTEEKQRIQWDRFCTKVSRVSNENIKIEYGGALDF